MADAAVKLVRGAAVVFRNTRVNLRQKMCSHAASLYTTRNALRVMPPICAAFWKRMVPTCCNQPTQ